MAANGKIVVLTNCASSKEARRIARALVDKRLAACVNIIATPVESLYRWKAKVEKAREYSLLIKTKRDCFPAVERTIRELHSYEVPEIIAVPVVAGSREYLAWLEENLR
ncbi:MAG TPA: divalent-cation tolerance protein CutA [Candidatus Acidoferrales bacterium]